MITRPTEYSLWKLLNELNLDKEADDLALGVTTFEEMLRRTWLDWFEFYGRASLSVFNYLHPDRGTSFMYLDHLMLWLSN